MVEDAKRTKGCARACLKNHFRNLQVPLCGIFYPHSDKIFHELGLAAHEKPFSATLWFTANIQKGSACPVGADSLLLVLLAKMRSSVYADFHEGRPTLVNIVGVDD